jgi:hypothetical protein
MRRTLTALAATAALTIVPAGPALAHVEHTQGDLTIAVGFATEPAYAGQPNAVQLLVSRSEQPVTDLAPGALTVEILFGGQTTTVAADPDFEVGEWGTPGDYRAPFIPTQPGTYTFHVTGSVDGTDVDFSTTSGPKTFSDVVDPTEAMFPPVEAPSNADLAAKISAEAARVDEAVSSAQNAADAARNVAIAAAVVAIVAIGLAIASRRRDRATG